MIGLFGRQVKVSNCNVVSKRDTDAKDVIKKCKAWVERLRMVRCFRPWLEEGDQWSTTVLEFKKSRCRVASETQNPDAARGKTGHLYLDEFAFYRWQMEIWTGALPSIESDPRLRVTIISTPNGTADQYHSVWTDKDRFHTFSRHKVDIYDAVKAGYPADPEEVKARKTADEFAQENMCSFLGAQDEYFHLEFLNSCYGDKPFEEGATWLGIDCASVVDMTAVQVLTKIGGTIWLGDTYIISRVPYETNLTKFRLGQEHIVDALITMLKPEMGKIDVTGDKARQVMHEAGLYKRLSQLGHGRLITPQRITKQYKDKWVQEMKSGLSVGRVKFANGRKDWVYTARNSGEFKGDVQYNGRIMGEAVYQFADACFEATGYDFLKKDFQKVHRKWLGPNQTTFDTKRDGAGHGDAFWAAVIGLSGIDASRARSEAYSGLNDTSDHDTYVEADYMGFI